LTTIPFTSEFLDKIIARLPFFLRAALLENETYRARV
jgi:hypothetical protein